MPIYNKLVRDKIPEIIAATGKSYKTTILDQEQYITELKKKSFEELEEYMNTTNDEEAIEELADLLELIHAMAKVHGATITDVEEIRQKKAEKRGGFEERVFLVEVEG
ncbi:MAG: nucleoside triphosphate pyrophosphohydrolase [Bacillaceae bacterium]|nr:nucleoside triphosphate pyrophosphohydrolase [Bacillaceae bacterium]